jgi:gamma-glutamyl hydrolase
LTPFYAENVSMPLELTSKASSSRWLGSAPANILNILTTQDVTLNNHQYGVSPDSFTGTIFFILFSQPKNRKFQLE